MGWEERRRQKAVQAALSRRLMPKEETRRRSEAGAVALAVGVCVFSLLTNGDNPVAGNTDSAE